MGKRLKFLCRKRDGDHDVDIVVGTMGKLLGMVSRSKGRDKEDREGDRDDLDLSQVRLFVLDEADKLVADSGISAVSELFSLCPGGGAGVHRLQVDPKPSPTPSQPPTLPP